MISEKEVLLRCLHLLPNASRTYAWFGQFRRLLVRREHLLSIYNAFFYLACFWITLRKHF